MREIAHSMDYDHPLLAELYDQEETYQDDVQLIRRLIDGRGPLNILECFCGTGRLLIPLASDGHRLTGIDRSAAMLHRAEEKLKRAGLRSSVTLQQGDALHLDWGAEYDLVILAANALNELATSDDQRRCIEQASQSLRAGGHVYVDFQDVEPQKHHIRFHEARTIFKGQGENGDAGEFVMVPLSYDPDDRILRVQRIFSVTGADGTRQTIEYIGKKRSPTTGEVADWLRGCDFTVRQHMGDRQGSPWTADSQRAIFWAEKNETTQRSE